jgi:rubrerythrin
MHDMTAANLRSAYGGESMAHMRYIAWAAKAEKEGFPNVARLFRAVSFAEEVHATKHFLQLAKTPGDFGVNAGAVFGNGTTSENLVGAIAGETFEIEEMYPAYIAVAENQKEKGAVQTFTWAVTAEKAHAEFYRRSKKAVDGGKDIKLETIHVCANCGWTLEGDAPDTCPVCNVKKKFFHAF